MKIRLVVAFVGLAISIALPAFAETNTPDPQQREQLLALAKKFENAWNNNDASDIKGFHSSIAVLDRAFGRSGCSLIIQPQHRQSRLNYYVCAAWPSCQYRKNQY
jgi:hypothetical protein